MKQKIKNEIDFLKQNNNKEFSLALLFTTIILFVYCYFGSFSFFENTFPSCPNLNYFKIIYHNLMAFVLFFIGGTIFTKFVIKKPLNLFGLKLGNKKTNLIIILIAIPVAVICGLSTVLDVGMTNTYPLINFNTYSSWYYLLIYFVSYFLYYVGWEFLFRGLLLFASNEKCGALGSILITTLISALIHTSIGGFGKPMIETLSAIPAGLIFGFMALKTKSIYPSLMAHFFIGACTDLFIFALV